MTATRVGYAGGELESPTYHHLGEHREAIEVTFDPRRISYRELLDEYWSSFPVAIPPGPSRARTAVFPRDDRQLEAAQESKRRLRREIGDRIPTEILAGATFWPAERMHQKFHLQPPAGASRSRPRAGSSLLRRRRLPRDHRRRPPQFSRQRLRG